MKRILLQQQHGRASAWLGSFVVFLITATLTQAAPGGFSGVGIGATVGSSVASGAHGGSAPSSTGYVAASVGRSAITTADASHTTFRGAQPAYAGLGNRTFSPNLSGGSAAVRNTAAASAYRSEVLAPQRVARVNNLWTQEETLAARQGVVAQTGSSITQRGNPAYYQQSPGTLTTGNPGYAQGKYSGTRLYPGSYGYNLQSYNDARIQAGASNSRHNGGGRSQRPRRYYSYYPYGYYPIFGDYGGYYAGDAGLGFGDASIGTPYGSVSITDPSTYDGGPPAPVTQEAGGNPSAVVPPGAAQVPAPVGSPQVSPAGQQSPRPAASLGPDSLVEAVQVELAHRGYFKGKVDAMFHDDTKEAVRRFQADNQLIVTGLLNNATLTMLGLN